MKSYIHFIRHGITEGNQKGWYYGSLDIPLTEEGVAALKTLKEQKIYPPLDHADCYTSGLRRTEETFCTIYGDVPHKALPLLQEMNFGAWEGMSFKEIEAADTHREAFAEWMRSGGDSSSTFTFPDGLCVATIKCIPAARAICARRQIDSSIWDGAAIIKSASSSIMITT